ncbi:putative divalent cation/proton antiporter TMEM165 isoform X2 [Lineus longissimus]|uniref:putative divalent cation/proton antiporter TMEM165 isoform X2 n=1 Tax=Lineus longissimus TaxID=88925 RepID=UPI002B4F66B5
MFKDMFFGYRNPSVWTLSLFSWSLLCIFVFPASGGDSVVPAVQLGENKDKAFPKPNLDNPQAGGINPAGLNGKGYSDNPDFIHGFVGAISVIIVSELGDKTFFIAAIMAMRHSRLTVFLGAIAALGAMTVLSALLGYATTVIPRWLTFYASSALFAVFGLKMLKEGYYMSADEGKEEYEEVQADLRKRDDEFEKQNAVVQDPESGVLRGGLLRRRKILGFISRIFLESFTLTFLAEWGDRSQIATIILAAREDVIGVILGGIIGHSLCTGLAVMGGRFIAQRISIRTVTLTGGVVFLLFALSAFFLDPSK